MLDLLLLMHAATAPLPDISFSATVDARSVRVERSAAGSIAATASPDAGSTARSSGSRSSRNFELKIDARIADPLSKTLQETVPPQPR